VPIHLPLSQRKADPSGLAHPLMSCRAPQGLTVRLPAAETLQGCVGPPKGGEARAGSLRMGCRPAAGGGIFTPLDHRSVRSGGEASGWVLSGVRGPAALTGFSPPWAAHPRPHVCQGAHTSSIPLPAGGGHFVHVPYAPLAVGRANPSALSGRAQPDCYTSPLGRFVPADNLGAPPSSSFRRRSLLVHPPVSCA
jgi:hypothetical protein